MWGRTSNRIEQAERGAVAVEFALVSVLLLMLLVALVGFAQVLAVRIAVTHAAREGARLAAVDRFDAAYVRAQAAQAGVDPSQVSVAGPAVSTDAALGKFVQVTVSAPVRLDLLGVDWAMSSDTLSVSSSARMRAEF